MNTLARLIGWLSTRWARVTLHWTETQCGPIEARRSVYRSLLDLSDDPALVGVAGKRRGRSLTSPADPAKALAFWRRCVGHWAFGELARRRDLTTVNWKAARSERRAPRAVAR
jgi:hypothetical protein